MAHITWPAVFGEIQKIADSSGDLEKRKARAIERVDLFVREGGASRAKGYNYADERRHLSGALVSAFWDENRQIPPARGKGDLYHDANDRLMGYDKPPGH